ncbi:MAG: hypothetical protein Q7S22_02115 [Candidatus Micrarchaeota archaeon]|nr:hypothetical protein [Candidatus Micrarchaeota archaeon]
MAVFLITLPNHDDLTDYCSKWSTEILKTAQESLHQTKKLEGSEANRKNFESKMTNFNPSFVVLNGHGNSKSVTGHANEAILSCDESVKNERLSKDKITYIRACGCGSELGNACITANCKSFIGYKEKFALIKSKNMVSRPLDDERAKPFFEVSNQIPIAILKGNTVEEAVEKADIKLEKEIQRLMTNDSFLASHIIPWLLWNKTIRVVLGNKKATIG